MKAQAKLVAHCDTGRVTEGAVLCVDPPPFTDTWHPFPHRDVLRVLETAVANAGHEVQSKEYSMNKTGSRMFGVWTFGNGADDERGYSLAMGFRNTMDKSFALGVCAGRRVFVCDNLAFNGEFVELRKHTSGLSFEVMQGVADRAMDKMLSDSQLFDRWLNALAAIRLPEPRQKQLTYDAVTSGVLPATRLSALHSLLQENERYRGNVGGWYGALTELWKGKSLFHVGEKSQRVRGFIGEHFGHILKAHIAEVLHTEKVLREREHGLEEDDGTTDQ